MNSQPMKRQYIMLRPLATGISGFARLETESGGLLFQLTCKSLAGQAGGVRAFLYAGAGAVQELGRARVNAQGQATLLAEMPQHQLGLAPSRMQAVLVTNDDAEPKPLFIGLCVAQSAGSLLDAKNALLALCAKLAKGGNGLAKEGPGTAGSTAKESAEESNEKSVSTPASNAGEGAASKNVEPKKPAPEKAAPLKLGGFTLRNSTGMPRETPPREVFLAAIDPNVYVAADVYATRSQEFGPQKAPAHSAGKAPKKTAASPLHRYTRQPPKDARQVSKDTRQAQEKFQATPALEEPRPRTPGAAPVDRLRTLRWEGQWQQLARYFEIHPPVMPFDAPGWRFVQVPMSKGGSFVVGRYALDQAVARICYALPGRQDQPPPKDFAKYRFQQGTDGVGYWVLWQGVR